MRYANSLLITLLLTLSFSAWSMNAELSPVSTSPIKEGDIIEAVLRVWPVEEANETQLRSLEGKNLFTSLYLFKINSIAPSINNADVIELNGTFIVKGPSISPSQFIDMGTEAVEVKWKGPAIQALTQKTKDFFVLNQSTVSSYFWLIVGIILLVFILTAILFRKKIFGFLRKNQKPEYTPDYFNKLFTSAGSREDFERIYSLKNYWLPLLKVQTPAHNDFFKVLNQHQYKKHWGADEINETKTSFEMIRRSFSQ